MALNVSTETTSADYINQLESLFSQGRITAKDLQDITTIGRGVFPEVNVWASNKLSEMQPSNPLSIKHPGNLPKENLGWRVSLFLP